MGSESLYSQTQVKALRAVNPVPIGDWCESTLDGLGEM
jgi:hypothetical protein